MMIKELVQFSDFTYGIKKRDRFTSFIKFMGHGIQGHGDISSEYQSYKTLSSYLNMPKVRLTSTNLVTKALEGKPVSELLIQDPNLAQSSLNFFLDDVSNMWDQTAITMNELKIENNIRLNSIDTLNQILIQDSEKLNLPLQIRGTDYPSISEVIPEIITKLTTQRDAIMVLGHGDEHLGNLFSSQERGYMLIDPRMAGYYSPAQLLNTLFGYFELFWINYQPKTNIENGKYRIDYSVPNIQWAALEIYNNIWSQGMDMLDKISHDKFLVREYLFANLIRTSINRVNPRNLTWTTPRKEAHLASAYEIYFGQ